MLTHRPVNEFDLKEIAQFPQNSRELFNMFPAGNYPLTVEQLQSAVTKRFESTVILSEEEVVGFANFYSLKDSISCAVGNVIVKPGKRGQGIGEHLTQTMVNIAVSKYSVKNIFISCFSDNFAGLLLYTKLGFKPFSIDSVKDPEGKIVPKINFQLEVV
jgi:ribosomal protein S18 acetylase RimI-like enzyme